MVVGLIAKGALKGILKMRAEAKKRIAKRLKAKPIKGPDNRTLAQRRGLVGDLTKTPKSQLSAADQVRRKTQLSRKAMKEGAKEMDKKVTRKKK